METYLTLSDGNVSVTDQSHVLSNKLNVCSGQKSET